MGNIQINSFPESNNMAFDPTTSGLGTGSGMFTKASGSPCGALSEDLASEAVEKVWMEEW